MEPTIRATADDMPLGLANKPSHCLFSLLMSQDWTHAVFGGVIELWFFLAENPAELTRLFENKNLSCRTI